jgi:cytochrome d ubiquinol oxidase subunit II
LLAYEGLTAFFLEAAFLGVLLFGRKLVPPWVHFITALLTVFEWRALNNRSELAPFIGAVGLFVMSYLGIAISLWPTIVPHHYTLWEAASAPGTQAFLLIGTMFLLPTVLMYTGWSYWVFRGKVRGDIGYH